MKMKPFKREVLKKDTSEPTKKELFLIIIIIILRGKGRF